MILKEYPNISDGNGGTIRIFKCKDSDGRELLHILHSPSWSCGSHSIELPFENADKLLLQISDSMNQ